MASMFSGKPAALCLEDLEDMIDVAEKHRDLTAIGWLCTRYADPFRKLKQLLAEDPRPVDICGVVRWYAKHRFI